MSPSADTIQEYMDNVQPPTVMFHNPTVFAMPQLNVTSTTPVLYYIVPQPTVFYAFNL